MKPQLLTVDEVAELLRIKRDTVYRLAARGDIPGHKIGRVWRFPRTVIDEFLAKPLEGPATTNASVDSDRWVND